MSEALSSSFGKVGVGRFGSSDLPPCNDWILVAHRPMDMPHTV